jgi:hypothetical protein
MLEDSAALTQHAWHPIREAGKMVRERLRNTFLCVGTG